MNHSVNNATTLWKRSNLTLWQSTQWKQQCQTTLWKKLLYVLPHCELPHCETSSTQWKGKWNTRHIVKPTTLWNTNHTVKKQSHCETYHTVKQMALETPITLWNTTLWNQSHFEIRPIHNVHLTLKVLVVWNLSVTRFTMGKWRLLKCFLKNKGENLHNQNYMWTEL